MVEGFPLDINIGDIAPRVRSAKKAIAGSGSKFGKLGDPQGVAVDQEGHVIVSDSRNHRLQVSAHSLPRISWSFWSATSIGRWQVSRQSLISSTIIKCIFFRTLTVVCFCDRCLIWRAISVSGLARPEAAMVISSLLAAWP